MVATVATHGHDRMRFVGEISRRQVDPMDESVQLSGVLGESRKAAAGQFRLLDELFASES